MTNRNLNDWLENYLYLTRRLESPTTYHLWCGISAIASALRRKCYIPWGMRGQVYPNFYISLVGPPGGRKGTAMKVAKGMVENLELPLGSDALGSSQQLYKELKDADDAWITAKGLEQRHKSLSIWAEEFQVFLSGKDPQIMPALTDLFDNPRMWKYGSLANAMALQNCWMNIIGAITPQLLQAVLTREAVGGGMVSRIIFVVGYGAKHRDAFPFMTEDEMKLKQHLQEDLHQIALLGGPFKLAHDFYSAYGPWYEHAAPLEGLRSDKFLGYNARRALHLNKLCMIISASESNDMIISARHFEKALAILEETEIDMPNAFYGVSNSIYSEMYSTILGYVDSVRSFTFTELLQKHQTIAPPREIEEVLSTLKRVGRVKQLKSATDKTYYEVLPEDESPKKQSNLLTNTLYRKIGRN